MKKLLTVFWFISVIHLTSSQFSTPFAGICTENPCLNNGECVIIEFTWLYFCMCPDGWNGRNCEIRTEPSDWSRWYNCSHDCREFRFQYSTNLIEINEKTNDCPSSVKTLHEFQKGIQSAKLAFNSSCTEPVVPFHINYCFESYGSIINSFGSHMTVHEISPVTYTVTSDYLVGYDQCIVALVWNFVYEDWIENIKVNSNGTIISGNYFQASKFFTISHEIKIREWFDRELLINIDFPPSTIKPEVALLGDSCAQAEISSKPICAYINHSDSYIFSTVGCETLEIEGNFTTNGLVCRCPTADAYVVLLEALPPIRLPELERVVAISGSSVNMASILVFFAFQIFKSLDIQPEGADIFNNILSSILLANAAILFDESVDYFRESNQQDIVAQSLAYSLITLQAWMLLWVADKSLTEQTEEENRRLNPFYQIFGWTVPIIYVFLCSCFIENYASYDYRHWPNINNNAIWSLYGPMAALFLMSFVVCIYKLRKIGNYERRVKKSLIAYLIALIFLFGKWSMGIWTVDIELLQLIFSILLWVQFISAAFLYCVYNYCCQ